MTKSILSFLVSTSIVALSACSSPSDGDGTSANKYIVGEVADSLTTQPIDSVILFLGSINDTSYHAGPVYTDSIGLYIMFAGGGGGSDSFIEASKPGYFSKREFYSDSIRNRDTVLIDFLLRPL
jgi:hypothetical protein